MMKWLPGSLTAAAAVGFAIAAGIGPNVAVYLALAVVFLVAAGISLRRAAA
jgi:hypothetical protein